jgi:hypothetical protein
MKVILPLQFNKLNENLLHTCDLCRARKKAFQMGEAFEDKEVKKGERPSRIALNEFYCLDHAEPFFTSQDARAKASVGLALAHERI